ncbi:outer membrane beta-barrel protein [Bradyrhizobium sp. ISRA443]|uniref:outer membrane protein n=1 Tax=unclassified Bradyrhizobium TaxID=2631580 RepID=UPI00247AB1F1|nr:MULTISPECIES: outer membrane beta-barrel protein [unclassified Bradyrhizobium]WGR92741.1 outer membrane beta-barrel protein [Bradyrhizobium sp. ISRA435]WGR97201.1 outer membrane beta-barrel protein [Bradyrhizobium sp. ISRA436]WGS04090.1 outer membrane beta-barrel protein [Bradyrhizobium sp. ISRA437]WGS10973.1 outer membrane beta-barrel protein [Bradyrhizobium sp. ISRA443]
MASAGRRSVFRRANAGYYFILKIIVKGGQRPAPHRSWGRSTHVDQLTGLDDTPRYDVNGGLAGGTIGYNWQQANWVFGIEGDWSWDGQNGNAIDSGRVGNPLFSSFTKEEWLATARGRLGYAADNVLLYVTGGYTAASAKAGVTSTATGVVIDQATQTRSRWTVGAGLEWGLAPSWSAKFEYLYVNLENSGFNAPNLGAGFNRSNVAARRRSTHPDGADGGSAMRFRA